MIRTAHKLLIGLVIISLSLVACDKETPTDVETVEPSLDLVGAGAVNDDAEPGASHIAAVKVPPDCRILALQSEGRLLWKNTLTNALTNLGIAHTLISTPDPYVAGQFTAAFNAINLNNFDAIVVGWSGNSSLLATDANEVTNALIGRSAALAAFLNGGGGLVAFSDWKTGNPYGYLPLGVTRAVQQANAVTITPFGSTHPVMAGLTNALLSNWRDSYHNFFTSLDPAYNVLALSSGPNPLTVAASFGSGVIVLTGHDPDWHSIFFHRTGALIFIDNALGFACEERAPPVTPFADFVIEEAEIELGPQPDDDEFEVEGSFTLGSASDGIDPRSEDVTLEVGTFTTTIPVGSFELNNSGEFGEFEFEGVIGGVTLEFEIRINEDNSFEFEVEGEDAHLTGTVNPVKVTLTIGDYTGTTSVTAEIEEEDDDEDDDEDEDDDDKDDDDEDDDGEDDDDEDE